MTHHFLLSNLIRGTIIDLIPEQTIDPATDSQRMPDEVLFREIYRDAPSGMARLSLDGRFLDVNPRLCTMLGCTPQQLLGQTFASITSDNDLGGDLERLQGLRAGNVERVAFERRCRHFGGETIWINASLSTLRDSAGLPLHYIAIMEDISQRKASEAMLLMQVSETTLRQIGQELHDDVGQVLTGAAMLAGTMATSLERASQSDAPMARQLATLLNQAVDKLRALSHGLYPVDLAAAGLGTMLGALVKHMNSSTTIEARWLNDHSCPELDAEQALQLYRIAQEASSNVIRHSGAKQMALALSSQAGLLRVSITDDGFGLLRNRRKRGAGIGLHIMRARAERIGASLNIDTPPGGGTCIEISLPLNPLHRQPSQPDASTS